MKTRSITARNANDLARILHLDPSDLVGTQVRPQIGTKVREAAERSRPTRVQLAKASLAITTLLLLTACQSGPTPAMQNVRTAESSASPNTTTLPSPRTYGDLPTLETPPVHPSVKLLDGIPSDDHRRYLATDLNGDGKPEYLIEDWAGAHSIGFVICDETGRTLMRNRDLTEFGGDRILVLTSKHHGYFDLICSSSNVDGIDQEEWQFKRGRYLAVHKRHFAMGSEAQAFVEERSGRVRKCWYADVFALPPGTVNKQFEQNRMPSRDVSP